MLNGPLLGFIFLPYTRNVLIRILPWNRSAFRFTISYRRIVTERRYHALCPSSLSKIECRGRRIVKPVFTTRAVTVHTSSNNDIVPRSNNYSLDDSFDNLHRPYPEGRPWNPLPVKPLFGGAYAQGSKRIQVDASLSHLPEHTMVAKVLKNADSITASVFAWGAQYDSSIQPDVLYYRLLHVIASTQSSDHAWIAYCSLIEMERPPFLGPDRPKIPYQHLHRLCRLILNGRIKNRTRFLRLLSLLYYIRVTGGVVKLFEWNALLDNAGNSWYMTRVVDFKFALDVFSDMVSGRSPGQAVESGEFHPAGQPRKVSPDIYTYTTLVNIASNTLEKMAFQQSMSLLHSSNIPINRITHLVLLKYFSRIKHMVGVRVTLARMREQGLPLGLDGINSLLWVFGCSQRLDLVVKIYRVLRHNIHPESYTGFDDIQHLISSLAAEENVHILPFIAPNEVTFTVVIQILAYHGHFQDMLDALIDMLGATNRERGAPLQIDSTGARQHSTYVPTLAVFRAIFLGFSRHGSYVAEETVLSARLNPKNSWSLSRQKSLFDTFLSYTYDAEPTNSMIYWILLAFDKTSNHNVALLRTTWTRLEKHFPNIPKRYNNRLHVLRAKVFGTAEGGYNYLSRHGSRAIVPRAGRSY